jgi:hypothetical protein
VLFRGGTVLTDTCVPNLNTRRVEEEVLRKHDLFRSSEAGTIPA